MQAHQLLDPQAQKACRAQDRAKEILSMGTRPEGAQGKEEVAEKSPAVAGLFSAYGLSRLCTVSCCVRAVLLYNRFYNHYSTISTL